MGLPRNLSEAMGLQWHRCTTPPCDALGRLQAQDVGQELPVARLYCVIQFIELRGRYCPRYYCR